MRLLQLRKVTLSIFILILSTNLSYSQWEKCTGKYNDLSVHNFIQVNDLIYGSTSKGIITSKDGINWDNKINFPFPVNELYSFNKTIFGVFGYNALKVTYSKDYGQTWEMLNTDTLNNFTRSLYSLLYDKGSIFLATGKGIYKTNDWGKSWKLINNKIIGNHIIHTTLLKVEENYFALDKNKDLYISTDYGRNWKLITENTKLCPIYSYNNSLYGLIDDQYLYKLNDRYIWEKYIDKYLGYISVVKPFCCNGVFTSSDKNRIIFNKDNIIELPKIPTDKEIDLLQEVYISKNYITVSTRGGLWYIPYNIKVLFN